MSLEQLGWDAGWEEQFATYRIRGLLPARVASENRINYIVHDGVRETEATLRGRYRHEHPKAAEWPAVGDWVATEKLPGEEKARIVDRLPRRTRFSRREAGDAP